MLKREFKVNLKSFIIWLSILIIMFLVVYLVYPFIITDDTVKNMDELMKVFPPVVLKAFNMDMSSIETAYGWFKTEGFMFVLLIIGFYCSILGGNILLKEENDKTIEYSGTLPMKRRDIVTNKIIVSIIYMSAITFILGLFNYIGLTLSGSFNHKEFILLSITPIFIGLPFFSINLFISTFLRKNKKTIGICLGMVFIFYLLSVLSELAPSIEFIKYFSIYTLADVRNVIASCSINIMCVLISILITIIFIIGTYIRYENKELL